MRKRPGPDDLQTADSSALISLISLISLTSLTSLTSLNFTK